MRAFSKILVLAAICCGSSTLEATDRFYRDIVAQSPGNRYEARAESPDNKEAGYKSFQAKFVYTLTDKKSGKTLWSRKQPMKTPVPLEEGSSIMLSFPEEASPRSVFVSDSGWTVIRTGRDEVIAVDISGKDRCHIKILRDGFTAEENKQFVHQTTAGPLWSGKSLWFFVTVGKEELFVMRPWWGRHIIFGLDKGEITAETTTISKAISQYEHDYVLAKLKKAVESRKKNKLSKEKEMESILDGDVLTVAYLAGTLKITQAVPLLRELEDCDFCGSSTSGGFSEDFNGDVNPGGYETFTLRQTIQLSLRRLGEVPKPLPVNRFRVEFKDYEKNYYYDPPALKLPRDANVDKIEKGMKAEQVLALLGAPDFVDHDTWEYDMDAKPAFSLIVRWESRRVTGIEKKTPPLWQEKYRRDKHITYL